MGTILTSNELQLIDKLVSWPVLGLILLNVMIFFRKGISKFFENRDLKFQAKEYGVSSLPASNQGSSKDAQSKQNRKKSKKKPTIDKAVIKTYENALSATTQSESKLKEQLAQTEAALDFEQAYNAIFGSQLRLMNLLNSNPAWQFGISELQPYLSQHLQVGGGFKDLDSLMKYLVTKSFVERAGSNYRISDRGQAFMNYIANQKYNLFKPF
jgi:hypothetical protein